MLRWPKNPCGISLVLCALLAVGCLWLSRTDYSPALAADAPATPKTSPQPVESDIHEFMEHYYESLYKGLKETIAAEPVDRTQWRGIRDNALALAEGGNLLLMRVPADIDQASWIALCNAQRDAGAKLYAAAKERNYQLAREQYAGMLKVCNSCHQKFADGEHQLEP